MNKKIFSFLLVGMAVCAVSSCSKDDDGNGGDSGAPGVQPGTMVSDDAEANAEVAGLRIVSVGGYKYTYDENGKLETISDTYNEWTASSKDNFKIERKEAYGNSEEEETTAFNISNNHITSISSKSSYKGGEGNVKWSETWSGTLNLTYNIKGQLSSITFSYQSEETETENGVVERSSGTENGVINFTYSADNRITFIEEKYTGKWNDGEIYSREETCEYEYSSNSLNQFYQYTPNLFGDMDVTYDWEAFAHVGLFGKASSYIPSRCLVKYIGIYNGEVDEEGEYYNDGYSCSFNSNGTISRADGYNYTYADMDTRALFTSAAPTSEQINTIQTERKPHQGFMSRLRERRHRL